MPASADSVRNHVALATLASLTRIAGGGYSVTSSSEEVVDATTNSNDVVLKQWKKELMEISHGSVSFTNKGLNNGGNIDGKPHDWEVRAALMLYHRVMACIGEVVEGKKKYEKCSDDSHALQVSSKLSLEDRKGKVDKDVTTFDIISDLGTRRNINSIKSLANLLAFELETELTGDDGDELTNNHEQTVSAHGTTCFGPTETQRTSFTDIRSNDSGIVCLLTLHRSKQLYSHGRIPCPNCIKWFKGLKGLWWHQLKVHGNQYSSATEVAAAGAHSLAIVPYQERNNRVAAKTQKVESELGAGDVCNLSYLNQSDSRNDAFDLVKTGKYNEFKELVEARKCNPSTQFDRNGASLLHWAAGCGRRDFLMYLIEQCECCPNQRQRGKKSFLGRTPLHWAARNGHMSIVEYLVLSCKVDVDAKTSDGTTAFCWASWQGHLEIMKYLFESGADIHSTNKFGCNALLWSVQGVCSSDILTWLLQSGLDLSLINMNGHSALHKAAQRGNGVAVHWLVNKVLSETTFQTFIGPDNEGNCPSDLCGMEGHENLAVWISARECDIIIQLVRHATSVEDLLKNYSFSIPSWLVQDLIVVAACKLNANVGFRTSWGPGCGVRRMSTMIMKTWSPTRAIAPTNELNDID